MRPTLFGVKSLLFFAAITGAFFAAPYVNLYFMLLAFFGAHWVLAVWWTAGNLRGLEVHVEAPQPVPSGAASSVRWTVLGDRPRFELTLRLDLEGGQHAEGELLFTGDQPSGRLVLPALERGVHRVRAATVRSSYPFDLLRRVVRLEAGPTIHVYPAPAEGALATRGLDVSSEEPEKGAGGAVGRTQPAGLRPRVEGESLRDVHWRASARRGILVVNEWEAERTEGTTVALDRRCEGEVLEARLAAVAAAVLAAAERGERLRLRSQGLDETYGSDGPHWHEALRFLAAADALPASAPGPDGQGAPLHRPQEVSVA